jgi:uroporphyrin-III C-methyltransferase
LSRPVESGRVYIVGAGPGDPELLTLRGAAVLAAADVVFHDQLVSEEVLGLARPTAELVAAGHRAGQPKREQRAVTAAMADRVRRGLIVCRLKGGDPFVFGRGGEDLEALLAEGVPSEVVPGVSSALAGPAAAGVPVTHRGVARSVLIVTGHQQDPEGGLDWDRLRADTVIVLMGGTRLGAISRAMLAAGWAASTPAMLVSWATTSRQRQLQAPLGQIDERAHAACLAAPALLVVGAVVELADRFLGARESVGVS